MKANEKMTKHAVMVFFYIRMEIVMKDNDFKAKNVEKAFIIILTILIMKENGKMMK